MRYNRSDILSFTYNLLSGVLLSVVGQCWFPFKAGLRLLLVPFNTSLYYA